MTNSYTVPSEIFAGKRTFFDEGNTRSYAFRIEKLKALRKAIRENEQEIIEALNKDAGKPVFEAFTSEVGFIYQEVNHAIKHLKSWMKPKRVRTPIMLELSKSKIIPEPRGVVLIMGPWNYPFQLVVSPLVGAIAAGNCVVLKPSDEAPEIARLIETIIHSVFESNYISVVQGDGAKVGTALLNQFTWNHVFFTGSTRVGKIVSELAAKHLCTVTLELGGKSPAIVDATANIELAAKKIVFGKFFNAGQTCVCPDYLLVQSSVKEKLVQKIEETIQAFYGEQALKSESLASIINIRRFEVLKSYLKTGDIKFGGSYDESKLRIAPTLIDNVTLEDEIMQDEIFGPLLPILEWQNESEIIPIVRKNRYPLACYIFTTNKKFEKYILSNIEFGGGCINNTIVHLVNPNLPFGGVGNSGIGGYHGKYSFDTFSHYKGILKAHKLIDLSLKYPPYTLHKLKQLKRFF